MNDLEEKLNRMLINTFNMILKVESSMVKSMSKYNLTISEIHILENIALLGENCTVSDIAAKMQLALPTVTVAVNKLVAKECITKIRCVEDSRAVRISLTETGRTINRIHSRFHQKMLNGVAGGMNEQEITVLTGAVEKLEKFFESKI